MCFSIFGQVSAQLSTEKERKNTASGLQKGEHQIGLSMTLSRNYNLTHRYALKDDLLLRSTISRPSIEFRGIESNGNTDYLFSLGASIGLEKHKSVGDNWSVYYGGEIGYNFTTRSNGPLQQSMRISALGGVKYNVNSRLSLFAEMKGGLAFSKTNGFNDINIRGVGGISVGALIRIGKNK